MASTILLLAWATIFASNTSTVDREFLLLALSAAGMTLSVVWCVYGHRANQYVARAEATALHFEGVGGPFFHRGVTRKSLPFPGNLASTTYVIPGVSVLFALLYAALMYASIATP
jgi:hypothetical protein